MRTPSCRQIQSVRSAVIISRFPALLLATAVMTSAVPRVVRADESDTAAGEPVAIRRVMIPPDRIAAELERVRRGTWVQLTRINFEERVRRARLAGEAIKNPPRLVEARYRATLKDLALVGTAHWRIVNPSPAAGILAVQPFNLAVQKARVQKTSFDDTAAVLGELGGKKFGLLVEQAGEVTAQIDWSARGVPFPGGVRFDLRVPPCAVASLELTLPADRVVDADEKILLSGPFDTEEPEFRLWHVRCGSLAQVELIFRKSENPVQRPLILAHLQARYEIEPDCVRVDVDVDLEVPHQGLRELHFECDPGLRPLEVNAPNLESWESRPGPSVERPSALSIRLREPFRDGTVTVQIHGLAALGADRSWDCPGVRALDAIARDETLTVRVHPDLRLEEWKSGDYLFVPAGPPPATLPAATGRARNDPWQVIALTRGASRSGREPARPRAMVRGEKPQFRIRHADWWQLRRGAETFVSELTYEIVRGALFQLPVTLPSGWEVEAVAVTPTGLLRHWDIVQENGLPVLLADLQRPLSPAGSRTAPSSAQLTVRLRRSVASVVPDKGNRIPLPVVEPRDDRVREGILGISVDPSLQAELDPSVGTGRLDEKGPWGEAMPDYVVRYQGFPASHTLLIRPRPLELDARCTTEVAVAPAQAAVVTRLLLQPKAGAPSVIDVTLSAPGPAEWNWQTLRGDNQVSSVQRLRAHEAFPALSLLGQQNALAAACVLEMQVPRYEIWRLTLARPLREPLLLQSSFTVSANPVRPETTSAASALRLPLMRVLKVGVMEGEVGIQLVGAEIEDSSAHGLWQIPIGTPRQPSPFWRSYGYSTFPMALELVCRRSRKDTVGPGALETIFDQTSLSTQVEPHRLRHRFDFQFWNWSQQSLPVRLPDGAHFLAARIDGRWVARLDSAPAPDGTLVVEIPVTAPTSRRHRIELLYESALSDWAFWTNVAAPVPELPVRPLAFRQYWSLPPGVVPLFKEQLNRIPGPRLEEGVLETWDGRSTTYLTPADPLLFPSQVAGEQAIDARKGPSPDAAGNGHDATGRYRTVVDWLFPATTIESARSGDSFGLAQTEWETRAGVEDSASLALLRQETAPVIGSLLTFCFVLVVWQARRGSCRARVSLCLACLGLSGLTVLWLPDSLRVLGWYPFLAAGATAVVAWMSRPFQTERLAVKTGGVLFLLFALGSLATAVTISSTIVFIVAKPEDPVEKQAVLAPPEILKQLQMLSVQGVGGLHEPVVLSAGYDGIVNGDSADIRAHFRIFGFADETVPLVLPLGGIQLKEARCDGAECLLVALGPQRDGYTLEVQGRGLHALELRFAAPVQGTGTERELRVSIPELLQSRLSLAVPAGSQTVYAVAARGAQVVRLCPAEGPDGRPLPRLETDLGPVATMHVRWRHTGGEPAAPELLLREAYLWNLHPTNSTLHAVLQFTVTRGAASSLVLTLPPELELRNVEAGRLPGAALDESPPRLKDWFLTEVRSQRRLHLELYRPVSNGVQLSMEFVPRRPLARDVVLPLPAAEGARTTEGLLAYRAEGLRVQPKRHLGISGDRRNAFIRFWKVANLDDPGSDIHAYTFVRAPGTPLLELAWDARGPDAECTASVAWKASSQQVELMADLHLTSPRPDVCFVECDVPLALESVQISGPDIRNWSRHGSRLQAWLKRPVDHTDLKLTGTVARHSVPDRGVAESSERRAASQWFALFPVRVVTAAFRGAHIQVSASEGMALEARGVRHLFPLPDPRLTDREFNYLASRDDYAAEFAVRPLQSRARVQLLTVAEIKDDQVTVTSTMDVPRHDALSQAFTVQLRNWSGGAVDVEARGATVRPMPDGEGMAWAVSLPERGHDPFRLRLIGKSRIAANGAWSLPDVGVKEMAAVDRWVAIAGRELRVEATDGLSAPVDALPTLRAWPAEAERIRRAGTAWRVVAKDWRLRLRLTAASLKTAPIQVLLAEMSSAVVDGRHWAHQATYWLHHQASAELSIALPEGARLLHVAVDGSTVQGLANQGRIWLPLSGATGIRTIGLSWSYEEGRESFSRPRLASPAVEVVDLPPQARLVQIPAGFRAVAESPKATSARAVDLVERRAEAQMQMSSLLAEELRGTVNEMGTAQLLAAQKRFLHYCRQLERRSSSSDGLDSRLRELKENNEHLAATLGFAKVLEQAQKEEFVPNSDAVETALSTRNESESISFLVEGTPFYWLETEREPVPKLHLESLESERSRATVFKSCLLLCFLVAAAALAFCSRSRAWLERCRPEALAVSGVVGWVLFGPGWSFALLVLFGLGARLATLVSWGTRWLRRGPRFAPTAGAPS